MAILRIGSFIFVPLSCRLLSEVVPRVLLSPQDVYWHESIIFPRCGFSKVLSNLYPRLHDFFVNECGVNENSPLLDYLAFLYHLATVDTSLKAARKVFDAFVTWSDGLKSGVFSVEDVKNLKRNLEEKVSVLMKVLGIPTLSEVVTREAIYYGLVNNRFETLLVNRVLPYVQRYIYNMYREVYLQWKLSSWVNEDRETGLLNDLEVYDEDSGEEHIEVRITDSARNDWFEISAREWEFAVEEGEFFCIARVILSGDSIAQVAIFKNPARLCLLGHLKLAIKYLMW